MRYLGDSWRWKTRKRRPNYCQKGDICGSNHKKSKTSHCEESVSPSHVVFSCTSRRIFTRISPNQSPRDKTSNDLTNTPPKAQSTIVRLHNSKSIDRVSVHGK